MSSSKASSADALLKKLRKLPGNMLCPNCGTGAPQGIGFGNICVKFKTFVCDLCKTSHQAISHRVKSVSMSTWTNDEVAELLEENGGGNNAALHVWLLNAPAFGGRYPGGLRPKAGDRIEIFKQFISDCYEIGKFKAGSPFIPSTQSSGPSQLSLSRNTSSDSFSTSGGSTPSSEFSASTATTVSVRRAPPTAVASIPVRHAITVAPVADLLDFQASSSGTSEPQGFSFIGNVSTPNVAPSDGFQFESSFPSAAATEVFESSFTFMSATTSSSLASNSFSSDPFFSPSASNNDPFYSSSNNGSSAVDLLSSASPASSNNYIPASNGQSLDIFGGNVLAPVQQSSFPTPAAPSSFGFIANPPLPPMNMGMNMNMNAGMNMNMGMNLNVGMNMNMGGFGSMGLTGGMIPPSQRPMAQGHIGGTGMSTAMGSSMGMGMRPMQPGSTSNGLMGQQPAASNMGSLGMGPMSGFPKNNSYNTSMAISGMPSLMGSPSGALGVNAGSLNGISSGLALQGSSQYVTGSRQGNSSQSNVGGNAFDFVSAEIKTHLPGQGLSTNAPYNAGNIRQGGPGNAPMQYYGNR